MKRTSAIWPSPPRALAGLALLVLATAGCGDLLEPAAAVVDGDKIAVSKVEAALAEYSASDAFDRLAGQGDPDAFLREYEQGYLSVLIRRAVLEPEAEARGLEITEEDVEAEIETIKGEFPSENAFEEALREQNITLSQLEDLVYDQLLEDGLRTEVTADAAPTEDELRAHYEENLADFSETEAQHILVEDQALAQEITDDLQAASDKKVDRLFDKLAAKHSIDQSNAANGGELGFYSAGDFVEPFERAAAKLEIDEISDPVETEFGFHVIRVTDRRTAPFEEVEEQLLAELGEQAEEEAWEAWVKARYDEADVEVNPRYGEFDVASQRVIDASAESIPGAAIPSEAPAPLEEGD